MTDSVLLFGWGAPIPGRETKALQVFGEALEYFARLEQEGRIEGMEPMLLEEHGGDLGGCFLIRGDRDPLARLRGDDDFQRMVARAGLVVTNVGVVGGMTGERLQRMMAMWQEQVAELAEPAAMTAHA
jgi:hypothetical protein